jgi:hypothetical protein
MDENGKRKLQRPPPIIVESDFVTKKNTLIENNDHDHPKKIIAKTYCCNQIKITDNKCSLV